MRTEPDQAFEALVHFLRDHRGFDFSGYKRASLMRRVRKRMAAVAVESFGAYQDFLEVHPEEFTQLFNTILINVTEFFRDAEAWEALAQELARRVLARKADHEPIRVWSAGCATGQETYTLAVVLAEALGVERFKERVKLYATDIDDEALALARLAGYPESALQAVPAALRERYFEPQPGERWVFRNDLRRLIIFGRHDLVQDAPISHLDLLVCRNTLMYFNSETQARILSRFHFALEPERLLFLGRAEMLRSHAALFAPVDLRARLFSRLPRTNLRERLLMLTQTRTSHAFSDARLSQQLRLLQAALDTEPVAQVLVGLDGSLLLVNQMARGFFGLSLADVGRPLQDLALSYRPVELRSRIEQVRTELHPLRLSNVEGVLSDGELRTLDVQVAPLTGDDGALVAFSVSFSDVTHFRRLQAELQEANQELETAFEELQSTNEELETTNEELQSTIEELETTNEELQSTNEELETMNEELQSTNEEIATINEELSRRTAELHHVNAQLASILTSLRVGVAVLDRAQDVRLWNRKAEDLWGVRADEAEGHAFQNLDIGLPIERLKSALRACIDGASDYEELVLDAINRRGKPMRCRVSCTPFVNHDREIRGAVVLMEEWNNGGNEV